MRVFLLANGSRTPCVVPHERADHVVASGACPDCAETPFWLRGCGSHPSEDDRAYEAEALCARCGASVGTLRVEVDTLFGVREDRAVLQGRARVY